MRKAIYILVLTVGFLQIIGYLTKIKAIRSLGIVTASAPLPIVFTEVKGIETFASDFYIKSTDDSGNTHTTQITPEVYSKLKGPYNRRNIYGAAIAYGPVLPEKLWKPILNYGLCNGILKNELQIPVGKDSAEIIIKTRTKGKNNSWILKTTCNN